MRLRAWQVDAVRELILCCGRPERRQANGGKLDDRCGSSSSLSESDEYSRQLFVAEAMLKVDRIRIRSEAGQLRTDSQ